MSYQARFRRVLDHVDTHLDENLSLERLAAIANFSKHHFHRQFTQLFGMGVYRYVQLRRLKRVVAARVPRVDASDGYRVEQRLRRP